MPRLSTVDQAFFLLETAERPMNIGALFVLVPPKGARANFADRLVRTMLKRPVGPPFSYRLKPGPLHRAQQVGHGFGALQRVRRQVDAAGPFRAEQQFHAPQAVETEVAIQHARQQHRG